MEEALEPSETSPFESPVVNSNLEGDYKKCKNTAICSVIFFFVLQSFFNL